ncbi:MAG: hypothetical protein U0235_17400 [Polyangiaceae bacterium]
MRQIAYHSATSTGNLYISEPYRVKSTDTGCISTGAGTLQNLTTHDIFHELSELITDPRGTAWYARASNHEVADACELASNMRFFQLAWSNAPNNALAYLAPLSSNATGGKCIFQRSTHINTFALGTDRNLYNSRNESGSWVSWGNPGPGITLNSIPAAISHDPRYIDVFLMDTAGHMRHAFTQDDGAHYGWDDWTVPAAGSFTSGTSAAAASWGAGRLDVVVRGQSGGTQGLFHRSWDAWTDSGWEFIQLPFAPSGSPGLTAFAPGRMYLSMLDTSGNVWVAQWTKALGAGYLTLSWDWNPLAGTPASLVGAPSIASHDPETWDIVVATASGVAYHAYYNPTVQPTTGWETLAGPGGAALFAPTIVAMGDSYLKITGLLNDYSLQERTYNFGWQPWQQVLWANGTFFGPGSSSW